MLQAYLAAISATDYAIGKVIDAVEATNADEDETNDWTILVVSKRGYQYGRKGLWDSSAFEDSTHTALMLYAPEMTTAEQRVNTPVSISDAAPTIISLAGIDGDHRILGKSLLPLLSKRGGRPDEVALTSMAETADSLRSQRFRFIRTAEGMEHLYDHDHDPEEAYNLLDPNQSANIKRFGMSETQVEAVRKWLSERLDEKLAVRVNPNQPSSREFPLPGDFNNDGSVDAADSALWRDNLGKEVPIGTEGDGDFDGRVEEDDRNVWLSNYGRKREPATVEANNVKID